MDIGTCYYKRQRQLKTIKTIITRATKTLKIYISFKTFMMQNMMHLHVLKQVGSSQSHRICLHPRLDSALLITK